MRPVARDHGFSFPATHCRETRHRSVPIIALFSLRCSARGMGTRRGTPIRSTNDDDVPDEGTLLHPRPSRRDHTGEPAALAPAGDSSVALSLALRALHAGRIQGPRDASDSDRRFFPFGQAEQIVPGRVSRVRGGKPSQRNAAERARDSPRRRREHLEHTDRVRGCARHGRRSAQFHPRTPLPPRLSSQSPHPP